MRSTRPDSLGKFESAFQELRTREDFQPVLFDRVFDDETLEQIRRVRASVSRAHLTRMKPQEAGLFRRFVVQNLPFYDELQARIVELVSEAAGELVEPSYNFLSLYGPGGVCPVHMDAPDAKWTLDLCIDRSTPWPIYFSRPQPWPDGAAGILAGDDWADAIKRDASNQFMSYTLTSGQAVLFSGSSQWHYRDVMPQAPGHQFCDLLFFHFIPRGTAELVRPENWPRLFNMPELI